MNVVSINKDKGSVRDDKVHGSLLVLNELLRISNIDWESQNDALMQRLQWDQNQTNSVRYIFALHHMVAKNLLWLKSKYLLPNDSTIIMILFTIDVYHIINTLCRK